MRKALRFSALALLILAASGFAAEADGDKDGIPDGLDKCPYTQPGAKIDPQGCALDADFDQIADGLDRCPGTAAGDTADADGCSAAQKAAAVAPPPAPAAAPAPEPVPTATPPPLVSPPPAAPPPQAAPAPVPVPSPAAAGNSIFDVLAPSPPAAAPAPAPAAAKPAAQQPGTTFYSLPGDPAMPAYSPSSPESAPPPVLSDETFSDPLFTTIYFVRNGSQIPEASVRKLGYTLGDLIKNVNRYPRMIIDLIGHTDAGEKGDAQTLSLARAEAVKAYLLGQGVPAERMQTSGHGSTEPLKGGSSAKNSRVEILTYPR